MFPKVMIFSGSPKRQVGEFVIGTLEMLNEDLAAALSGLTQFIKEPSVLGRRKGRAGRRGNPDGQTAHD